MKRLPLLIAILTLPIVFIGGFLAFFHFATTSTVMTRKSPDKQHIARLSRVDGMDVIFRVVLDGRTIYSSPDFAPTPADFREQLMWDETGHRLVLEVAERRLFGFDVQQQRPLTDNELADATFTPFAKLGYEGDRSLEVTAH